MSIVTNNIDCLECTSTICLKCASPNTNRYLKYDSSNCISDCTVDSNTYTNSTVTINLKCILCNIAILNCSTCTNSTKCLSCANSSYLLSNNTACVANCLVSDLGFF